jgi:hypothetical protein
MVSFLVCFEISVKKSEIKESTFKRRGTDLSQVFAVDDILVLPENITALAVRIRRKKPTISTSGQISDPNLHLGAVRKGSELHCLSISQISSTNLCVADQ